MRILILFLFCWSFIFVDDLKELKNYIEKIESGNMDVPYDLIYSYDKIIPNNPVYLYLRGLIEVDGSKSIKYYKKLYDLDPKHDFADDAAMKIGEYYYSIGYYIQASEWLKKMPVYYPRSNRSADAVDLFIKSLIISGKQDTAMFYLKIIKNQMPNVNINDEYIDLLKSTSYHDTPDDIPKVLGQYYFLQIGVYADYSNARKVRDVLNLKGFNSQVEHKKIANKRMYIVIEGRYLSERLANKASKKIKRVLNFDSIVKKNN
tara:strand:+ start:1669 stop:2451 length:783 start_codon:yes stop_codon:yes gene_type:complete